MNRERKSEAGWNKENEEVKKTAVIAATDSQQTSGTSVSK